MPAALSIAGQRFGRLVAIERVANIGQFAAWRCQCDCGGVRIAKAHALKKGECRNCGCSRSKRSTTPNCSFPEYRAWRGMVSRCHSEKDKDFRYYGAKGVQVCERWRSSFLAFRSDIGPRPGREYTIDRINTYGDYEPGNCRWATMSEQNANRRPYPKTRKRPHRDLPQERPNP